MYACRMTQLRRVLPTETTSPHAGIRSKGRAGSITIAALCECGWSGPERRWYEDAEAAEHDLTAHGEERGHERFEWGDDGTEGLHTCGYFHELADDCPAPPDSPRGRLERAMQSTLGRPGAALDRLAAVAELRTWLDEQEQMAVIGARMDRVSWMAIGRAVGTSRQGAWNRWGAMIRRYEDAGLLDRAE